MFEMVQNMVTRETNEITFEQRLQGILEVITQFLLRYAALTTPKPPGFRKPSVCFSDTWHDLCGSAMALP